MSEQIAPQTGQFDVSAMGRGEPGVPKTFTWRGQRFDVVRTVDAKKKFGSDRGDSYVRRHYFDVETGDALRMRLYFERNPSDRSQRRAWWLYTVTYPDPILEAPRVSLRRWTLADRDAFRRLTQDPQVMRFLDAGLPLTDEQADAALLSTIARYDRLGLSDWAIVARDSGDILGESGLDVIETTKEVEIGWMLFPKYWGQGLGHEAAFAVKQHAMDTLGIPRLIALIRPENESSIKLAHKLGMQAAGRMPRQGYEMLKFEITS